MIFAPPSDAGPHAGSERGPDEAAGIDDQWPDEPPTIEPVQLPAAPAAPRVPTAAPATKSPRGQGARRGARWVALGGLALVAGAIGLRAYVARTRPVATPGRPPAVAAPAPAVAAAASAPPVAAPASAPPVAAPASDTETPLAPPSAPVSAAPPVEEPLPLASTSAEPSRESAFDAAAAKQALDATASAVARCRRGNVSGPGYAIVTFGNDGAVRRSAVSPPFLGTAAGMCVARALAQARVPAFVNKTSGVVVHNFVVPGG